MQSFRVFCVLSYHIYIVPHFTADAITGVKTFETFSGKRHGVSKIAKFVHAVFTKSAICVKI